MEKKIFKLEDFCKVEDRTEHFCRYTFPVLMEKINCHYYKWNINPILSECLYKRKSL